MFCIKLDGWFTRRKARFLGGGHLINSPFSLICSAAVTTKIAFFVIEKSGCENLWPCLAPILALLVELRCGLREVKILEGTWAVWVIVACPSIQCINFWDSKSLGLFIHSESSLQAPFLAHSWGWSILEFHWWNEVHTSIHWMMLWDNWFFEQALHGMFIPWQCC